MSIKVEVFSAPNCNICGKATEILKALSNEIGDEKIAWRKVNVVEEIDLAVSLGIISTPSIVIDDELVFSGLPTTSKLREALLSRLKNASRIKTVKN
ncbi:MAG TPA: glutaredoxin [Gammaproteobacteria bacterium]|nr:glutaredoxin [Gammaproteobacteria bacterium]